MKTIIVQSFRTIDVPDWLALCMGTVKQWASNEHWDYECLDDTFFELAPSWVRDRCLGNIYSLTDICRLLLLRSKLKAGYERVIWVDADVLIYDSDKIDLSNCDGYAFSHELFLRVFDNDNVSPVEGINNAVMIFERKQLILDSYIERCFDKLRHLSAGVVPRTELGPTMLMEINNGSPLDLIYGIGLFTLPVMRQIAVGQGELISDYMRLSPTSIGAANLCHFMRNEITPAQKISFDDVYFKAVSKLIAKKVRFK